MLDPYVELANAIIEYACRDYEKALRYLKSGKTKDKFQAEKMKNNCERFFKSQWFGVLTEIDGESLMKIIHGKVFPDRK